MSANTVRDERLWLFVEGNVANVVKFIHDNINMADLKAFLNVGAVDISNAANDDVHLTRSHMVQLLRIPVVQVHLKPLLPQVLALLEEANVNKPGLVELRSYHVCLQPPHPAAGPRAAAVYVMWEHLHRGPAYATSSFVRKEPTLRIESVPMSIHPPYKFVSTWTYRAPGVLTLKHVVWLPEAAEPYVLDMAATPGLEGARPVDSVHFTSSNMDKVWPLDFAFSLLWNGALNESWDTVKNWAGPR